MKRSVQTSAWPLPNQGVRFITPPRLRRALARHPLGQACYPLALGYYPKPMATACSGARRMTIC
ncbi:transcriptional regulator [Pseudomonas aeruginosa]|nr:transcriptional regulator [Pseudomonas aeruginosa]